MSTDREFFSVSRPKSHRGLPRPQLPDDRHLTAADVLTLSRIAMSAVLLFVPVPSAVFTAFYLLSGVTDVLDGFLARRSGTVHPFGARLDSSADFIFFTVCFLRLFPFLPLPVYLLLWAGLIALVKISTALFTKRGAGNAEASHSLLNKITGLGLFLLPLTLNSGLFLPCAVGISVLASFATVQEAAVCSSLFCARFPERTTNRKYGP